MGFASDDIKISFDPGSQFSFWGEASPVHRGERVLNLPVQGMQPGAAPGFLTCGLHLEILILGSHRDAPDLSRFKVSRPLEEDRTFLQREVRRIRPIVLRRDEGSWSDGLPLFSGHSGQKKDE